LGRFKSQVVSIPANNQGEIKAQFYVGPKDQYTLEKISDNLDLSVDYSFLWMVAQPLYAILYFFNEGTLHAFGLEMDVFGGVGNWGFSIILLTILVKALFFGLNAKAYRSMAKMRAIQPKMMDIKNLYGDDRQKQSQEMMKLYQTEGVNPIGGCLPMLVQMPVFIALYWVLLESVELRHAPFIGYIKDLSAMDPYFIMPLIMGASMWFQQKLNPPPPDPMQAKVMQFLPIIFTFFFLFFPSGLVLYWVVNNILSIAQQWVITRNIEKAQAK
jgi:YidC/Oxa1 family membrane protein insertase